MQVFIPKYEYLPVSVKCHAVIMEGQKRSHLLQIYSWRCGKITRRCIYKRGATQHLNKRDATKPAASLLGVCKMFFHLESVATNVMSPDIHDNNVAVHVRS